MIVCIETDLDVEVIMKEEKTKNEFEAFEVAMLIQTIYSKVMHIIGNSLLDSGLTHQQIMIIKLIAHKKEINISDLCKEMSLTKGTVSGIVQRLETAGYVEKIKHNDDQRNTYVVFSEKGKQFAREFRESINDSFQSVFNNFTEEEMTDTRDFLSKLKKKLKEIK